MKKLSVFSALGVATAFFNALAIGNPRSFQVHWTPGDYSNFVVVSSVDIKKPVTQWPVYLVTSETNFYFTADEANRFFAVYGTNADGESAWGGQQ